MQGCARANCMIHTEQCNYQWCGNRYTDFICNVEAEATEAEETASKPYASKSLVYKQYTHT